MPTFEYQAEKADGTLERGVVIGSSLDGAARDLASKGFKVTQIGLAASAGDPIPAGFSAAAPTSRRPVEASQHETPRPDKPYDYSTPVALGENRPPDPSLEQRSYMATSVAGPLVGTVPLANLGFFFRQGATMLDAAVPIVQSLNTLAGQARNEKLAMVLREMSAQVQAGHQMSAVMQRYPEVFTPVMLSMVRAGEEGGFLAKALMTVADYIDEELALRNLYKRTTFWPKVELVVSILVVVAANAIIDSIRPEGAQHLWSPLTTWLAWIILTPIIVASFLWFRVGLANPRMRYNWDRFVGGIPYLGKTLHQISMARFGRAFGALYKSGVPMQRALTLSADACGNEYLRSKMYPAYSRLQTGDGLTETLESTDAFSPIVMDMIRTGETTGNVDQMLNRMSDFYIGEAEVRQTQLGYAVGLFLTLCVAIYIGAIVINFYMSYGQGVTNAAAGGG